MFASLIPALFGVMAVASIALIAMSLLRAKAAWKVLEREWDALENGICSAPVATVTRLRPAQSVSTAVARHLGNTRGPILAAA